MNCAGCDLTHLPICVGANDAAMCDPAMKAIRQRQSIYQSSIGYGWPSTQAVVSPPPEPVLATASRPPIKGSWPLRRGKPVIPLGVAQTCAGCGGGKLVADPEPFAHDR
jgi:hypothetical protein